MEPVQVTVEFYGVPRQRAKRAEVSVTARTIGDLLVAIETTCPEFADLTESGRLRPQYLLSLDGREFVTDQQRRLQPGERWLLLSADAGG